MSGRDSCGSLLTSWLPGSECTFIDTTDDSATAGPHDEGTRNAPDPVPQGDSEEVRVGLVDAQGRHEGAVVVQLVALVVEVEGGGAVRGPR